MRDSRTAPLAISKYKGATLLAAANRPPNELPLDPAFQNNPILSNHACALKSRGLGGRGQGSIRSEASADSAALIRAILSIEMFVSALSTAPIKVRCSSARSASSSWLMPSALRRARTWSANMRRSFEGGAAATPAIVERRTLYSYSICIACCRCRAFIWSEN